ncbi:MAG: SDR family NAD(P)-dependent oxidoreductase [Bdellovibrionaceae bacterium]|nr:SDR family NAD(P)-dependent oxidoreductase [Pseudobdellovibrionaceae bacterium]
MGKEIVQTKSVFITGATSGIGLATARAFAAMGYSLILNGRRRERLHTIEKELSAQVSVTLAPFDVSSKQDVVEWFKQNEDRLHSVEILINNAGLARGTDPLQVGDMSDWDEMIDTNIKGLLYVTRQTLPHFLKNQKGHIVNIGSVAGRWIYPGGAVYSATKHSVRAISETLRLDTLGKNIRVTNIEPGMVETEFSEVRFRDKNKAKAVYQNMTPLTAQDIAETITWAVSRPSHVNIQELVIYPTDQASVRDVFRS